MHAGSPGTPVSNVTAQYGQRAAPSPVAGLRAGSPGLCPSGEGEVPSSWLAELMPVPASLLTAQGRQE